MATVSVVIPSYNGCAQLKKNLSSVFATLNSADEVVIVDDASSDETISWLVSTFKLKKTHEAPMIEECEVYRGHQELAKSVQISLTVLRNNENLRFGQSVNRGVILATGSLIFLLNNDVQPEPKCVQVLRQHFVDESVFGVGCLEYTSPQRTGEPSGKNKLWFEQGTFKHSKAPDMNSGQTAWVSGGSGMFSREKWLLLKGFDAAFYPAYWEDIDLSQRARALGWKVLFDERAVVYHLHESTNAEVFGSQLIINMGWRNGRVFTWRHASWWQRIQFLLWYPYWKYQELRTSLRR